MQFVRSLLFALVFYPATFALVLAGLVAFDRIVPGTSRRQRRVQDAPGRTAPAAG